MSSWGRQCACAALLVCGCAREPLPSEQGCDVVLPGDLVITEVHANPDGSDGDGEYIELFNTTDRTLALAGLTLVSSRGSGTGISEHRFGDAQIAAGAYFVLGSEVEAPWAHVDYAYGSTLGNLRNSDAALSIECGATVIDWVGYSGTRDGHSMQLDGALTPDGASNDDSDHWCFTPATAVEFSPGNFGTPGAPNDACEEAAVGTTCIENGTRRAIESPAPGELLITEWMPNPNGPDGELEWVELQFVVSGDLNDLRLGAGSDSLDAPVVSDACFPVDAGARVVFGASPAAAPRVDAELGFSLGNGGERSIVVALGDSVLDRVDYVGSEEGVAWQVDPDGALCLVDGLTDQEYRDGNFGTPGEANPVCAVKLEEGQCFEGDTPRSIRSPTSEQVQITEWMANPSTVDNRRGEWIEIRVAAAVDLNGLVWSDLTGAGSRIEREECLSVPTGGYAVFARNANESENGGIPIVDAELDISLNNGDETISVGIDGEVLDSISYDAVVAGAATQIDAWGYVCSAVSPYGEGDLGTPGAPNPPCR